MMLSRIGSSSSWRTNGEPCLNAKRRAKRCVNTGATAWGFGMTDFSNEKDYPQRVM